MMAQWRSSWVSWDQVPSSVTGAMWSLLESDFTVRCATTLISVRRAIERESTMQVGMGSLRFGKIQQSFCQKKSTMTRKAHGNTSYSLEHSDKRSSSSSSSSSKRNPRVG
mmetsp:Transcript_34165/g.77982  ORF Transcript_34165/g.77982 Transcript_34165/m.77982 type:complete len:110 (-) Transcript_34165:520-849(-)